MARHQIIEFVQLTVNNDSVELVSEALKDGSRPRERGLFVLTVMVRKELSLCAAHV